MKYLLYVLLFCSIWNCKKNQELEWIKRSALPDIDIYIFPNKFNILEGDWINTKHYSKFNKNDLIRHLRTYGHTLEDLKNNPELEYTEVENIIQLKVGKTAHSTPYEYDSSIPIIFYGPTWFQNGEYFESIHQQHIVPTLAKILKIRNPNGVETHPLTQIIKLNSEFSLPEIIVTIVIDQAGQQYYKAHPEVPNMISNIRKDAAYFPNALVGHIDVETAVGHAAIGTGAYPRKNGIIGNGYIKKENDKFVREEIYDKGDRLVNPSELLTETLADVLDHEYRGESEIISQCYALRASVGMAGHGSAKIKEVDYLGDKDIVYWINTFHTEWVTDERYYTLPMETAKYNPLKTFNEEYPNGWEGINIKSPNELRKYWGFLMSTPAETRTEAELFREVIQNNIIAKRKHNDGIPDLAYLTIKSTDSVAHQFGFESLEAKETFKEADKQVGIIFDLLKKEYGDKFILIITADHGGTPLPEISGGERLTFTEFFTEINSMLPPESQESESLIRYMTVGQIALNHDVMKKHTITEKQIMDKILSLKVKNKPFFNRAYLKSEIQ